MDIPDAGAATPMRPSLSWLRWLLKDVGPGGTVPLFVLFLAAPLLFIVPAEPDFCGEAPEPGAPASIGKPQDGRLVGGVPFLDSADARILPIRHVRRCIRFGTPRLVAALTNAGARVRKEHPGSPPLGVGNLSRAQGGPIRFYSRSHQVGRDVDVAFYPLDAQGRSIAAEDLPRYDAELRAPGDLRLDVPRNWTLVQALLEDATLDVEWLFVSEAIKAALLAHARQVGAPTELLQRAEQALHQPSDAPPHDDHLHLRIRCTEEERKTGCL